MPIQPPPQPLAMRPVRPVPIDQPQPVKPVLPAVPIIQPPLLDSVGIKVSSSDDKYAAFSQLQPQQRETASSSSLQPNTSDLTPLRPGASTSSSDGKYSAFRNFDSQTETAQYGGSSGTSSPQLSTHSGDKYGAFEALRPQSSTPPLVLESFSSHPPSVPAVLPAQPTTQPPAQVLIPQPVRQVQHGAVGTTQGPLFAEFSQQPPQPPSTQSFPTSLQPLPSTGMPLSTHSVSPLLASMTAAPNASAARSNASPISFPVKPPTVYVPSQFSPPPLLPEAPLSDHTGTKGVHKEPHTQEDDGFGEFAQFSSPFTAPDPPPASSTSAMGSLFPPPVAGRSSPASASSSNSPTPSFPVTSTCSPAPDDATSTRSQGVPDTFGDFTNGGGEGGRTQTAAGDEGWANFGEFSPALTPQPLVGSGAVSPVQPLVSDVQPSLENTLSGTNESGLLTASQVSGKPQSQKSNNTSPSRTRGFEFHRRGSKEDRGATPTIDGMEKELLSKLTPTLTRKTASEGEGEGGESDSPSAAKRTQRSKPSAEKMPSQPAEVA